MKNTSAKIVFLLFALGWFVTASFAQAATISCDFTNSTGVCDAVPTLPPNCKLVDLMAESVQMSCDGQPQNYDCAGTNKSSQSCTGQNFGCSGNGNFWRCDTELRDPPPNCRVVQPLFGSKSTECNGPPEGYSCKSTEGGWFSSDKMSCGIDTQVELAKEQALAAARARVANPEMPGTRNPDTYSASRVESTNITYVPLEPFPGLEEAQSGEGDFGALLQGFFKLLVNIGAFIAVTVLVIGGITYMVSEATVTKFVAREKIKAAFWGLAILAGAWLILNTINPQLLTFDKDLVKPNPTYVVTTTTTLAEGAEVVNPSADVQKKLEQALIPECVGYGASCIVFPKRLATGILVFDPRTVGSARVQQALQTYESNCSKLGFASTVQTAPGNLIGEEGYQFFFCLYQRLP